MSSPLDAIQDRARMLLREWLGEGRSAADTSDDDINALLQTLLLEALKDLDAADLGPPSLFRKAVYRRKARGRFH